MTILKDLLFPMPGEQFDGRTVIASTWLRDGFTTGEREYLPPNAPEFLALVLLLNAGPPYYTVAQLQSDGGAWTIAASEDFPNINPAVIDGYAQWGGDY